MMVPVTFARGSRVRNRAKRAWVAPKSVLSGLLAEARARGSATQGRLGWVVSRMDGVSDKWCLGWLVFGWVPSGGLTPTLYNGYLYR